MSDRAAARGPSLADLSGSDGPAQPKAIRHIPANVATRHTNDNPSNSLQTLSFSARPAGTSCSPAFTIPSDHATA